jgi:hypothetical protein
MVCKARFTTAATAAMLAACLVIGIGGGAAHAAAVASDAKPTAKAAPTMTTKATNPVFQQATADEQRVLDDIVKAEIDMHNRAGDRMAALDRVERAETVLLNARQAGYYKDPQALKSLETADAALRQGKADGVRQDLRTAENALRTPSLATTDVRLPANAA